jgi:hypothetical protein
VRLLGEEGSFDEWTNDQKTVECHRQNRMSFDPTESGVDRHEPVIDLAEPVQESLF